MGKRGSADEAIRTIRRKTRQQYNAEEKCNGQTDGQVNRLKCIKQQMCGRARFDLQCLKALIPPVSYKVMLLANLYASEIGHILTDRYFSQ